MWLMFVAVVWFCCFSWLDFLLFAFLICLMHHFLFHWVICLGGYLFVQTPIFFWKKTCIFRVFCVFFICYTIMPKLWMSGVRTLCAIANYRASLSYGISYHILHDKNSRITGVSYVLNYDKTFILMSTAIWRDEMIGGEITLLGQ